MKENRKNTLDAEVTEAIMIGLKDTLVETFWNNDARLLVRAPPNIEEEPIVSESV